VKRSLAFAVVAAALLAAAGAFAAERTVTLVVEKMFCPACPYIVKRSLAAVPGVKDVKVSYRKKTAIVRFDDAKTNVEALTAATLKRGYPSKALQAAAER